MLLTYIILGLSAGILSGLLGVGGGIIVVPGLMLLFKTFHFIPEEQIMHMAVGTSFMIMVFTTSVSAWTHLRYKLVSWSLFWYLIPYICLGLILGMLLGQHLSNRQLQTGFAIFLICMSIYLFYMAGKKTPKLEAIDPTTFGMRLISALICILVGALSGFFGIGGSTLIVPYLLYIGEKMHNATGTAVMCVVPMAIVGSISSMYLSKIVALPVEQVYGATGFVYWPAVFWIALASICGIPMSTKFSLSLSEKVLKRLFAIIMILNAFYLIFN